MFFVPNQRGVGRDREAATPSYCTRIMGEQGELPWNPNESAQGTVKFRVDCHSQKALEQFRGRGVREKVSDEEMLRQRQESAARPLRSQPGDTE